MHRRGVFALMVAGALVALPATGQTADDRSTGNICVLDESVLMARSPLAAAMATRFREVRETAQRSFDTDARALDADERAFAARGTSLAGEAAVRQRLDLAARRDALRQRGEQINRDLASLDKELARNVVRLALPTIRAVEAERHCAMLVARSSLVDLADPSRDISIRVVEALNAASPAR